MKTRAEFDTYKNAVTEFLEGNHVRPGCCSPKYNEDGDNQDPSFSWRPCECCGSTLGGDREAYQFARKDNSIFEADICQDCVYFLAYGTLDDATMTEIETSATV